VTGLFLPNETVAVVIYPHLIMMKWKFLKRRKEYYGFI
jgi:hypothetical protein